MISYLWIVKIYKRGKCPVFVIVWNFATTLERKLFCTNYTLFSLWSQGKQKRKRIKQYNYLKYKHNLKETMFAMASKQ